MKKHFTNKISNKFEKFASKEFSKSMQSIINNGYVKLMGLDMSEFLPASKYKTLNQLFTRKLVKIREFPISKEIWISPCDSYITELGVIKEEMAMQIKGMEYNVSEFITKHIDAENKNRLNGGTYINFYLSPKDYHHYHIPIDMRVTKAIHISGKLYPVNIPTLNRKKDLFIENERVVLECYTKDKKLFFMVLVGALNVGKMVVYFEKKIETNIDTNEIKVYEYEDLWLNKGDDLGYFMMGSTVILLTQEKLKLNIKAGDSVVFSQAINKI
jgi:phosphatidylserine decarboxylase